MVTTVFSWILPFAHSSCSAYSSGAYTRRPDLPLYTVMLGSTKNEIINR